MLLDALIAFADFEAPVGGSCSVLKLSRERLDDRELRATLGHLADRLRSPGVSAEAAMVAREQLLQVWKTVEALSEKQRSVFLLRFVEEMELSEIATALGLHVGTVKSHLHRALTAVRKGMEKT